MENVRIDKVTTSVNPNTSKVTLTLTLAELIEITAGYGGATPGRMEEIMESRGWPKCHSSGLYGSLCKTIDEALKLETEPKTFRFKHRDENSGGVVIISDSGRCTCYWNSGSVITSYSPKDIEGFLRSGLWIKL